MVEQTTQTISIIADIDASEVGNLYRLEIGGGDNITNVVWDSQGVFAFNIGALVT